MAFDPERHIHRLAPLGATAIVIGVAIGRWWSLLFASIGLLVLLLSCRSDRDGFLLFGPFVRQEMISLVRRTRFYGWRALALALTVMAFLSAASVRVFNPTPTAVQIAGTLLVVATSYITMLVVLPGATQLLLGAISGERESNRLDFLLVTDLRNREIVFGRTLSKILPLFAHLAILLPFAAAVAPLFGVPQSLVVVPILYIASTFFATSGLTVFGSTMSPTIKQTNPYVGLLVLPFALGTGLIDLLRLWPEIWTHLFKVPGFGLVAVGDILEYISAANPIGIVVRVANDFTGGGDPLETATEWLPIYAAYQLAFGFLGFFVAAKRLRIVSAALAGRGPTGSTDSGSRQLDKPMVSDRPVYWKEKHFHELLPKTKKAVWIFRVLGFLLSYLPGIAILVIGFWGEPQLVKATAGLLTGGLPLIAWILLAVGLRVSAAAIARERERDTLTSLIMTPIPPGTIIYEKWLGAYAAQASGLLWLLVLGIPAVITGMYPPITFVVLLLLTLSFLAISSSLGLLASITAKKTEKANQQAVIRGVLGVLVQVVLAIVPLILGLTKTWAYGIHLAVVICPISTLIFATIVAGMGPNPAYGQLDILITGLLAALHLGVTAWLVYRRARNKFVAMCADGTIDAVQS
jgi:ABC-type Na+ efflux pump permease subunit